MSDAPPPVSDNVLDDLWARVRATRRAAVPHAAGRGRGVDPDYVTALLTSWADHADWCPHEERVRTAVGAQRYRGCGSLGLPP